LHDGKNTGRTGERFSLVSKLWGEKIPFVFLSICAGAMTLWAQNKEGAVASADSLPFVVRSLNAVVSYVTYLKKYSGLLIWRYFILISLTCPSGKCLYPA